jgi:Ca2+-binding EF-hand superfamily protein
MSLLIFILNLCVDNVDKVKLQALFDEYDTDRNGHINVEELESMLVKLGVAPLIDPLKKVTSLEKKPDAEKAAV